MMRTLLKSKLYYATVTEAQLYYRGSITIDEDLMKAADLLEYICLGRRIPCSAEDLMILFDRFFFVTVPSESLSQLYP